MPQAPTSDQVHGFLDRAVRASRPKPRRFVTGKGEQFWCRSLKRRCKSRGVRPRHGRVGEPARIAIVERFIRSMRRECTRCLLVSLSVTAMRRELRLRATRYNALRPHTALGGKTRSPGDSLTVSTGRIRYRRFRTGKTPPRKGATIEDLDRKIAEEGLKIGAIKLNPEQPFQWASGYRMPIYNDNRMFLFLPELRRVIARGLADVIEGEGVSPEVVAGTATAGIPHGALLSDLLGLPFIYIRDRPKGHGLRNRIEGIDAESDLGHKRVVVIEDLISTGGSSARAVEAVREANGACDWCLSIFSYGLGRAAEQFAALDPPCEFRSLLTFPVLLDVARTGGYLSEEQIVLLADWREDPFGWGARHGFPRVE